MGISELVRLKGFEPPTYWFVASHSIQLSYSRIYITRTMLSIHQPEKEVKKNLGQALL